MLTSAFNISILEFSTLWHRKYVDKGQGQGLVGQRLYTEFGEVWGNLYHDDTLISAVLYKIIEFTFITLSSSLYAYLEYCYPGY